MPYIESVRNYNTRFNTQLDAESLASMASSILTTFSSNSTRQAKFKDFIIENFPEFAAAHEQSRQIQALASSGASVPTDAKDLLVGYVNLLSEIVREVSQNKIEEMKQAQIQAKQDAQKAVEEAKAASDVANKARENREFGAKQKIEEANALVQRANLRMERANDDESFKINPWEPRMDYFGITAEEAKNLMLAQVNGVNYSDVRRDEISRRGVTDPVFMQGINAFSGQNYATAEPEAKEQMNHTFITRELMKEKLDSKKGISGWFWRLFHRSETKAMRNYIKAADDALTAAGFTEEAKAEARTNPSSGVRIGSDEVTQGLEELKNQFEVNDKKLQERARKAQIKKDEMERLERERLEKEKLEKEEKEQKKAELEEKVKASIKGREKEIKKEADVVRATKAIPDSFFEIRFRPALDLETNKLEADRSAQLAMVYIKGKNNLPEGLKTVFNANYKKIRAVREFFKNEYKNIKDDKDAVKARLDAFEESFVINEEIVKGELAEANIDYKPITFDQLKLQNKLEHDLNSNKEEIKAFMKKDDEEPKKEAVVDSQKDNEELKKDDPIIAH